ncbi:hypothetical protein FPRO06_07795 [Fusarium proliferatum]|nr:hypothetical protein FPRO06_07795 [Fusarium proliferatum]
MCNYAKCLEEFLDRNYYRPVNSRSGIGGYSLSEAEAIVQKFAKDADFKPPIGDDGKSFIGNYWANGPELRRSTSLSSSSSPPTRPAWTSLQVRQKGSQSFTGVCNRDTISKDNTEGDGARMENLLANVGRKIMGIKREEPAWINAVAGLGCRQENRRFYCISPGSERRPGLQATNNGDSCIHHSDNEDDILSNTSLLPVKQGFKDEGGYNGFVGFVIPNMDQDVSINPSFIPWSISYEDDNGEAKAYNRLRWVQGVALRGHLRGIQFPVPESQASTSSPSLNSNTQQLLDYYDKNIAGLMVWIDSEKNYYRQKVLPLAQTNEAVRLAICAVSAQHAARDFTPSTVYEKDRDHVLSMIMHGVDDMTAHPQLTVTADTAEWMLSSMMVLSSYELAHTGGADAADFHRKAARALVNTLSTLDFPKSSLFGFLQNQLSMYDIFASTTIFDATDVQDAIRPIEFGEDRSFSAYLLLLHDATLISRGNSPEDSSRDWRGELAQARGQTLMEVGNSGICSGADRGDFIRLVDAYHNAALLYTARCLDHQHGPEQTVCLFDLFRLLTSMENLHASIHNLAWPIFVAGTECYGDHDRQFIVRDLYKSLSEVTGFKHHGDVLTFLETFWSSGDSDWRILAKQWEGLGRRILAV